jgi:hypothetical protein
MADTPESTEKITLTALLDNAFEQFKELECSTLKPFIPFFFFKNKPMSFKLHFPMLPFFKYKRPRRTCYMCGRQEGKSASLGMSKILRARIVGNYDILTIQPRYEQIKRFSSEYVRPFMEESPISTWICDKTRESSILKRPIGGGGTLYYSYAFLSPDAVRGYAVQELIIDEAQDVCHDFYPVIEEVLSAQTEFGTRVYSGTPKTYENALSAEFHKGSQAYIHIKCDACNFENIANKDHHIYKMIGKKTCICAKCGRPLDLLKMFYVHHYRDRRLAYESYHTPQVVHPVHAWFPENWAELIRKRDDPTYGEVKFENEILGLPSAHNATLITEAELMAACNSDIKNDERLIKNYLKDAREIVMGIDWSGFGESGESTTVFVIAALFPGSDVIQIIYMERLRMGADPLAEARRIRVFDVLGTPRFIAHDNGGAGTIREAVLAQMGVSAKKLLPFELVHAPVRGKIVSYSKPPRGGRSYYSIDKVRSLMIMYNMIKTGNIRFPEWNSCKDVLGDLKSLVQDTHTTPKGAEVTLIQKLENVSDDAAHAVNFACAAIWHLMGKYPKMAPAVSDEALLEDMIGDVEERARIKQRLKILQQQKR